MRGTGLVRRVRGHLVRTIWLLSPQLPDKCWGQPIARKLESCPLITLTATFHSSVAKHNSMSSPQPQAVDGQADPSIGFEEIFQTSRLKTDFFHALRVANVLFPIRGRQGAVARIRDDRPSVDRSFRNKKDVKFEMKLPILSPISSPKLVARQKCPHPNSTRFFHLIFQMSNQTSSQNLKTHFCRHGRSKAFAAQCPNCKRLHIVLTIRPRSESNHRDRSGDFLPHVG